MAKQEESPNKSDEQDSFHTMTSQQDIVLDQEVIAGIKRTKYLLNFCNIERANFNWNGNPREVHGNR